MKKFLWVFSFSVLLSSCGNIRSDGPYGLRDVDEPQLYNLVFENVYEKMAYFMNWKLGMNSTNEVALLLECEKPVNMDVDNLVYSDIVNGWEIIEDSAVNLSPQEIVNYSSDYDRPADLVNLPTAKFYVHVSGNNATVYVYFWLMGHFSYTYQYGYSKIAGKWILINTQLVGGSKS